MQFDLKPGKYVVAVSGGVDSIVLLELLVKNVIPSAVEGSSSKDLSTSFRSGRNDRRYELIVAHFDHGIREDSAEDRKLVEQLAKKYDLVFESGEGHLGPATSEATARTKRYEFLRKVKAKHHAQAIITAHHQDDLLETVIINLLRGTGRRGLSSLKSTAEIKRPLLNFTKRQLVDYAKVHNLTWREDSTNLDETYLRNWIRHQIMPKLSDEQRASLLESIHAAAKTNPVIEQGINELLSSKLHDDGLDRTWFNQLPHDVAKEIMVAWLKQNDLQFDHRLVEQLTIAAKTFAAGKTADINKIKVLKVGKKYLALTSRER